MLQSTDQDSAKAAGAEQPETVRHLSLTILGVVFVLWGSGPPLASFLYAWLQSLSSLLGPPGFVTLLLGIAVLCVIPMKLVPAIPRTTTWTVVGIGFLGYVGWNLRCIAWISGRGIDWITWSYRSGLSDRTTLGLMIAGLGLTLIASNRWGPWILRRLRDAGSATVSWSRTHVKMVVIPSLLGLWLLNPFHAHQTCIDASRAAERYGAYRAAVVFTRLARDTFPTTTGCGNCFMDIQESLTRRISHLACKNAGHSIDSESPSNGNRKVDDPRRGPSWNSVESD
jgi:hypothetical protein